METYAQIGFGPHHATELFATLGCTREEFRTAPLLHNDCYITPHYQVYQLPTGYWLIVEQNFSTTVRKLGDKYEDFAAWRASLRKQENDPETGRYFDR